ncbi:MAG: DUF3343 domain-containing protein [Oscillospiraceae bacterium]|nr:DUF3343 domain-containing protein [Oscillospiraceae bacterium]
MEKLLITCRTLTHAQRCVRLLERRGIVAAVIKAPPELTRAGCGYAVSLRRSGAEAVRMLREASMLNGKIYRLEERGWREVSDDLS